MNKSFIHCFYFQINFLKFYYKTKRYINFKICELWPVLWPPILDFYRKKTKKTKRNERDFCWNSLTFSHSYKVT